MNSATPTATGHARIKAMVADSSVPQASATIPNRGCGSLGNQSLVVKKPTVFSRSAGTARTTRNRAIATMMTRTRLPAPSDRSEKTRSPLPLPPRSTEVLPGVPPGAPGRTSESSLSRSERSGTGPCPAPVCGPVSVLMPVLLLVLLDTYPDAPSPRRERDGASGSGTSCLAQRVDSLAHLLDERRRQWRVADRRDRLLPGRARGVAEEGLLQRQLLARGALLAHDLVAHQDDRVDAVRLRGVVNLQLQVIAAADELGRVDRLAGVLRGELDGLACARGDLRGLEARVLDERQLEVPDGSVGALHARAHAVIALGALTAGCLPLLARAVRPARPASGGHVLGEVVGGARGVGPVEGLDRGVRQRHARVELGDRGVGPLGDLPAEDAGDRRAVQHEVVDALHVVRDADRAGHHRQVDRLARLAAGVRLGLLIVLQRRVGAAEVDRALEELLHAGSGADRLIVDGRAGARLLVLLDPLVHGVLLGAGAGAGQRAALALDARSAAGVAGAAAGAAAGVVVRAAGGERERARDEAGDQTGPLELHVAVPPRRSGTVPAGRPGRASATADAGAKAHGREGRLRCGPARVNGA